jgi:hypothetical protein
MARRWYAARSLGVARSEPSTKRCMNQPSSRGPPSASACSAASIQS